MTIFVKKGLDKIYGWNNTAENQAVPRRFITKLLRFISAFFYFVYSLALKNRVIEIWGLLKGVKVTVYCNVVSQIAKQLFDV
jgi:hypothetical protein